MKLQEDDLWIVWKNKIKKFFKKEKINIEENLKKIKPKKNKFSKFPCKDCLVYPVGCKELCDKVEMDEKKLMKLFEKYSACPDCGSQKLYEGPSGGMSQNVTCAGCGHSFNLAFPVFVERI